MLTPLLFTAPRSIPGSRWTRCEWFQVVTLLNPLTYVSEGMRASLTDAPHLGSGWIVLGLAVSIGVLGTIGVRKFIGRAID